jgi:hypothetical protein
MPGSEQADERRVDRISRPAIGRVGEVRAHLLSLLARTDERQRRGADRVIFGLTTILQRLQGMLVALAGTLDYLWPTMIVSVLELVEQAV